jgi:hypothetical protein
MRHDMKILTLDLATHFGWCFGPANGEPRWGAMKLPTDPKGMGATAKAYHLWLTEIRRELLPDMIAFEAPINGMGQTNMRAQMILKGLIWHTEFVGEMVGVDCVQVGNGAWKKHICGSGRVSKKMKPYPPIVECKRYGYDITNDNAADAVCIWMYVVDHINPGRAALRTPLFAGAA